MFYLTLDRGEPVIRVATPFEGKSLWLPAALLSLLIIPFGAIGAFAPAVWLSLAAIENTQGWRQALAFMLAAGLMLVVSSGLVPGNQSIAVIAPYTDSDGNLVQAAFRPAKAMLALTLVAFMLLRPQPLRRRDFPAMAIGITVPVTLGAVLLGLSFKLSATLAIAALINLLVVCIAEEGFFRWVVQRGLTQWLQSWRWLPVALVTLLFTTLHTGWAASPLLLSLVAVAGFAYAMVWHLRQSFWACVLTHWGVNLLHMLMLPYPN